MSIKAADVKTLREMTGAGMMDCKNALVEADGDIDKASDILREKGIAKTVKKAGRITAEGLVETVSLNDKAVILEVNSETDFVAKNQEFKDFVSQIAEHIVNKEPKDVEELMKQELEAGKDVETALKEKIAKIGENLVIRRFQVIDDGATYVSAYNHGGRIGSLVELKTDDKNYSDPELQQFGKDLAMQVAASAPRYLNIKDIPEDVVEKEKEILVTQALNESPEGMDEEKAKMIATKKVEGRMHKQLFAEIVLNEQAFIKDGSYTIAKLTEEKAKKFKGLEVLNFVRFEVGEGLEKRSEDFADEVAKQMNK